MLIEFDKIDDGLRERVAECLPEGPADQCWLWTGSVNQGYARLKWKGRYYQAHRLVWVIANGEDLPYELVVHHNPDCESKLCCNPNHLRGETQGENLEEPDGANAKPHELMVLWRREHLEKFGDDGVADVRALKAIAWQVGDYRASGVVRVVVNDWDRFVGVAANTYGFWNGDADLAPTRPISSVFLGYRGADAISAALMLSRQIATEESQRQVQRESEEKARHEWEASAPEREKEQALLKIQNRKHREHFEQSSLGKQLAAKKTTV